MPGPDGKVSESSERWMPQATSSAVTGLPSSHFASSRIVKVHSVKSSFGRAQVGGEVGDQERLPVLVTRVLRERAVVSACWIELPVTDQPSVGSSESGPGSPGR